LDANGLSCNHSASEDDLTRAKLHEDCDREAIPRWHAVAYFTLMSSSIFVMHDYSTDEKNSQGLSC